MAGHAGKPSAAGRRVAARAFEIVLLKLRVAVASLISVWLRTVGRDCAAAWRGDRHSEQADECAFCISQSFQIRPLCCASFWRERPVIDLPERRIWLDEPMSRKCGAPVIRLAEASNATRNSALQRLGPDLRSSDFPIQSASKGLNNGLFQIRLTIRVQEPAADTKNSA